LNIKEKLKILKEKEVQIKEISEKNEKANATWRQYKTVYYYPNHYSSKRNSSSSDISIIRISFKCYCYRSIKYYIVNCEFQIANKDYIKNLYLKKKKRNINTKSSQITKRTKKKKFHSAGRKRFIKFFKRKKHSYTAVNQSSNDSKYYTETELSLKDNSKKKSELDKIEKIMLIKEEISKSISADWALNTEASLFITDQFDLYKKGFLKSSYNILI